MKAFIEREALIKEGWFLQRTVYGNGSATIESKQLKDIPTADVVAVRHGRWVKSGQSFVYPHKFRNYSCSVCGYDIEKTKYNYCPNCGADMRET